LRPVGAILSKVATDHLRQHNIPPLDGGDACGVVASEKKWDDHVDVVSIVGTSAGLTGSFQTCTFG